MNVTIHDSLWRKIAFSCVNGMSWLVIGFGTAGILFVDWRAALSAVLAIVVVAFASWLSVALTDVTARRAPAMVMPVALGGFVAKIIVFALVLALFNTPAWLEPMWSAIAAIAAIIVWQIVEVFVFLRHRQRIFDAE